MELTVMTITVHSSNVVTAEGVEITAEGLTQVSLLSLALPLPLPLPLPLSFSPDCLSL